LVREFRESAMQDGTMFTAEKAPEKLRRTPERQDLVSRLKALGAELRARAPIAEIRAMFEDEDVNVRAWASPQLQTVDPEWGEATFSGVCFGISTRDVLALWRRALDGHVDRRFGRVLRGRDHGGTTAAGAHFGVGHRHQFESTLAKTFLLCSYPEVQFWNDAGLN